MGERKKILKIKCEQNISFPEARKQYKQFYQAMTYATTNLQKLTTRPHRRTTALQNT